jgi:hypothetical protein
MPVQMCSRVLNLLTRLGGRITFVALIAVAFIEGSHEYGGKNSLIRTGRYSLPLGRREDPMQLYCYIIAGYAWIFCK